MDYSIFDFSIVQLAGRMEKSIFSKEYELFLLQLREARKQSGLTQQQLAARLNQTQSFISKCERGERRLDIVEVRAFCTALDISFPAFVTQFDQLLSQKGKNDESSD